jgi:hypothetical protein
MQDFINKEENMNLIQAELKKNKITSETVQLDEEVCDPYQAKLNDLVKRVKDLP